MGKLSALLFIAAVGAAILFLVSRAADAPLRLSANPSLAAAAASAPTTSGERKPASSWTTNEAGISLIKASEGLRLTAYKSGSKWYIGYGHSDGVTPGMTITESQADAFLRDDLRVCERGVGGAVTVPVTQNEFSAMVSFCFTVGTQNLSKSSIVKKLNTGDRPGAADAFLLWVKAGGKVIPHLVERRKAERALFLA